MTYPGTELVILQWLTFLLGRLFCPSSLPSWSHISSLITLSDTTNPQEVHNITHDITHTGGLSISVSSWSLSVHNCFF